MHKIALTVNDIKRAIPAHVAARAKLCSPALASFAMGSDGILLQFWTSSAGSRNSWIQTIQMIDWQLVPELVTLQETNAGWDKVKAEVPEIMDLLNVHVHCNCPAFLWYGSQYQLTQLDTSMYDESIYPYVRDPFLQNTVCKHLAAVFDQFFVPGAGVRINKPAPAPAPKPEKEMEVEKEELPWAKFPEWGPAVQTRTDMLPEQKVEPQSPSPTKEWDW